jgi:hypothetical protein
LKWNIKKENLEESTNIKEWEVSNKWTMANWIKLGLNKLAQILYMKTDQYF